MGTQVYLGLGSNLGDRQANIQKAVDELKSGAGDVVAASSVFECDSLYDASLPRFLNAILVIDTGLKPKELLKKIKAIEKEAGRTDEQSGKNAARNIDIDILLYGGEMIEEKDLIVPHPAILERLFVLMPLDELNPGIEMNGKKVSAMVKRLMKLKPDYRIEKTGMKIKY